ncbi:MAG: DUF5519 family protein [Euryarchaeota archaeon]|nr:DUF5519 family protein [Euryarchaeota archaeon]
MATTSTTATTGMRIVESVSGWPSVESEPHRFGATAFVVENREIGHLHDGRVLDINLPKRVKDCLLADGHTDEHRFAGGGWTTYRIDPNEEIDHALWLCRLSYLYTLLTMRRKPVGRAILADLDLDAELEQLDPDPEIRAIFDRMRS